MKNLNDKKIKNEETKNISGGGTEWWGLPPGAKCPNCGAILKDGGGTHKTFDEDFLLIFNLKRDKKLPKIIGGYLAAACCPRCWKTYQYRFYETE